MTFDELISSGAPELGVTLPEGAPALFHDYWELAAAKNAGMNLTAISGEEDAARLHFLDSLGILKAYPFAGKKVVDVGAGGGFPGVPLKIAEPSIRLTLMDATVKKVDFLRSACGRLGIEADFAAARAEEAGRGPMRESFDIAVARAVARLNVLAELCLPLVRPGGALIAMKSADSDGEIAEASASVRILGGAAPRIFAYSIPGTGIVRRAVIIEKTSGTAAKYPRRFALIKKSPL